MAIQGTMVSDMTGHSAAENWNCLLRRGGLARARGVMDKYLGNP